MKLIAAVDNNWAIGNKGRLLARIPEDQKFFRNTTMGHVVVLGRKTLEEFPGAKPLAGRTNIILSRNNDYKVEGATVVHSLEELFQELKQYDSNEIYIIGGKTVYDKLLPYCDTAIITKICESYEADTHIENLDILDNWKITSEGETHQYKGIKYTFTTFKNLRVANFE
jgi:dihydrofolate reductase